DAIDHRATGQRRQVEIDERTAIRTSALIGSAREEVIRRAVTVVGAFRKDRVVARCPDGECGWGQSSFQEFENRLKRRSDEALLSAGEPDSPHRVAGLFLAAFLGGVTQRMTQGAEPALEQHTEFPSSGWGGGGMPTLD